MRGDLSAQTVRITATDGDEIEAYAATPGDEGPRGGVVVIHHLPGYDRGTKEIVRRYAEFGYDAICPNLYSRQAPGAAPDDGERHRAPSLIAVMSTSISSSGLASPFTITAVNAGWPSRPSTAALTSGRNARSVT